MATGAMLKKMAAICMMVLFAGQLQTMAQLPGTVDSLSGTVDSLPVVSDALGGVVNDLPVVSDALGGVVDTVSTASGVLDGGLPVAGGRSLPGAVP